MAQPEQEPEPVLEPETEPEPEPELEPNTAPQLELERGTDGELGVGQVGLGQIGLGQIGTIGHSGGRGTAPGRTTGGVDPGPKVLRSAQKVTGGLSNEVARRVLRQHVNGLRSCYVRRLTHSPKLAGKLEVTLDIDAKGAVSRRKLAADTLADDEVGKCVLKYLKGVNFPAPKAGAATTFEFTLTFVPE